MPGQRKHKSLFLGKTLCLIICFFQLQIVCSLCSNARNTKDLDLGEVKKAAAAAAKEISFLSRDGNSRMVARRGRAKAMIRVSGGCPNKSCVSELIIA